MEKYYHFPFSNVLNILVILSLTLVFFSPISISAAPIEHATKVLDNSIIFIENIGQLNNLVYFQVRGRNSTIWFAEDGLWVTVTEQTSTPGGNQTKFPPSFVEAQDSGLGRKGVNIKISFVGANPHPNIEPFDRLETFLNYFIGNDQAKWITNVPVWGGVRYFDLYPGIDLEISSNNGRLEPRLVLHEGANLDLVRLSVNGAEKLTLNGDHLLLSTSLGEYTFPLLQVIGADGAKRAPPAVIGDQVTSPFSNSQVKALGINPQSVATDLLYATFLGGNSIDYGRDIALDSRGAVYVTGWTESSDFPTTLGTFDSSDNNGYNAFVVKLNSNGSVLAYATFLGGSEEDNGNGIAIDSSGAVYVTGYTRSADFPTTPGALDMSINGESDTFVAKLNMTGSVLDYSTFLGGGAYDEGDRIAVDSSGSAYITGTTQSSDFPTTLDAFEKSFNGGWMDAYVAKLNPYGSSLIYSTFLGGNDYDIGVDISIDLNGNAYVTGDTTSLDFPITPGAFNTSYNGGSHDAFVVKLDSTGSALTYATFLGGTSLDSGIGIAVDSRGAAYVTGWTESSDFPTTLGAYNTRFNGGSDAFVVKLNSDGSILSFSTFLGGSDTDLGRGIAIDSTGDVYVTGDTGSFDFPTSPDAFGKSFNGGSSDGFVAKLDAAGSALIYSSFIGGGDFDIGENIVVDSSGSAYVTGRTWSSDFPSTPGVFDTRFNGNIDAFVVKLAIGGVVPPPPIEPTPVITPDTNNNIPTLLSPADNSTWPEGVTLGFSWFGYGASYLLEINNSTYDGLITCGWQAEPSCSVGPLLPGVYTWHVKVRDSKYQEGPWSQYFSFTVQPASIIPTAYASDGQKIASCNVICQIKLFFIKSWNQIRGTKPVPPSGLPASQSVTLNGIPLFRPPVPGVEISIGPWGPGDGDHATGGPDMYAIDYLGPAGTPIKPALAGDIVYSGSVTDGYGYVVAIRHVDQKWDKIYYSIYAHLDGNDLPKVGTKVDTSTVIGYMGCTGTSSIHLHFAVRVSEKQYDGTIALYGQKINVDAPNIIYTPAFNARAQFGIHP